MSKEKKTLNPDEILPKLQTGDIDYFELQDIARKLLDEVYRLKDENARLARVNSELKKKLKGVD